jgi:hypothetical protein
MGEEAEMYIWNEAGTVQWHKGFKKSVQKQQNLTQIKNGTTWMAVCVGTLFYAPKT